MRKIRVDVDATQTAVSAQPGVTGAACVVRSVAGEPALVAYVTPATADADELTAALRDDPSVHGYQVPKYVVPLETIAYHAETGAPDIERLPMPTLVVKDYVAPRSFLEEHIAAIWRKVLESEAPISVEADFFEVGGNSLMAGKLIAAMRKQLKVPLSVAVIFSHRTVADMATLIAPQVDEDKLQQDLNAPEVKGTGAGDCGSSVPRCFPKRGEGEPAASTQWWVLLVQLLPMCVVLPVRRIMTWLCYAYLWLRLMEYGLDRFPALLASLCFTKALASVVFPLIAIALKWLVVGHAHAVLPPHGREDRPAVPDRQDGRDRRVRDARLRALEPRHVPARVPWAALGARLLPRLPDPDDCQPRAAAAVDRQPLPHGERRDGRALVRDDPQPLRPAQVVHDARAHRLPHPRQGDPRHREPAAVRRALHPHQVVRDRQVHRRPAQPLGVEHLQALAHVAAAAGQGPRGRDAPRRHALRRRLVDLPHARRQDRPARVLAGLGPRARRVRPAHRRRRRHLRLALRVHVLGREGPGAHLDRRGRDGRRPLRAAARRDDRA